METRSMKRKKEQERGREQAKKDNDLESNVQKKNILENDSNKTKSQWGSTKTSSAKIALAKKKAELTAARKKMELEKALIDKELEIEIAELSVHDDHSTVITEESEQKVKKWLFENKAIEDYTNISDVINKDVAMEYKNYGNENNNLSDIQLLAREISNLRRPADNRELQPFFGNISEWLSFKASYDDSKGYLSELDNIARLRRCLRGNAREAVAYLLHTHVSPDKIMEALELRFGRSELILQEQIINLKELPKLNDSTELLCKFAGKVQNCVASIKSLKKPEYLYNVELLQTLKSKMTHLKHSWLSYASEHEDDKNPELVILANFLHQEAMTTSKYWILEQPRSSSSQRFVRTFYSEEFPEGATHCKEHEVDNCYTSNWPDKNFKVNCPFCNSTEHRNIQECNKFKLISVDERWKWAQNNRYCFKCLRSKHKRDNCRAKTCGINGCRMSHHQLLHANVIKTTLATSTMTETLEAEDHEPDRPVDGITTCSNCVTKNHVLLKIIPVTILGPLSSKDTFALLDEGSTLTLLKEDVAIEIGMKGRNEPFTLAGVNATTEEMGSKKGNLEIVGPSKEIVKLDDVRTIKKLPLTTQTVSDLSRYEHLRNLPLKDLVYEHAIPELLIGQDNWHALIAKETRCGRRNEPVATLTALGWVVHGFSNSYTNVVNFVGSVTSNIDEETHKLVEDYFKIESMGICIQKKYNSEDTKAMEILQKFAKRVDGGRRWEVALLWRDEFPIMPNSFINASKRLRFVEKKMDSNREYGLKYKINMDHFMNSNYAEPCQPTDSPKKWYLPHFGVTNVNKPGKLRIVFDAACKVNGTSLNDKLLTGPDILSPLLGIIFKFREGRIAVSADIREMFLQIRIRPEDQPAQRFLWRDYNREVKMKEHEMKSLIFGAVCSPTTAIYILRRNAEEFVNDFPRAVHAIKTRFYMDDYLDSFHSEGEAIKIIKEVADINLKGGFTLTQWTSNSSNVNSSIDETKRGSGGIDFNSNFTVKVLGLIWHPNDDTLGFNLNLSKIAPMILDENYVPTKREALRTLMSLFDPLGLLSPIIISGKILLQCIWKSGVDWDQKIKETEAISWTKWLKSLKRSYTCSVPRCYNVDSMQSYIELHVFCDASEKAFSSVAYWRFTRRDGKISISIIASKSRVSPAKAITIPRLELMAAVLGVRLANSIIRDHEDMKVSKRYFWTDSSIVFSWINGRPRDYKTFVANRLGEVLELSNLSEWNWLPTDHNVADDATRGLDVLNKDHRWFVGPEFLYKNQNDWPRNNFGKLPKEDVKEMEIKKVFMTTTSRTDLPLPYIGRFSKWLRLIRSTAYVLLFIECVRTKDHIHLQRLHIDSAEILWIKQSQGDSFSTELAYLKSGMVVKNSSSLFKLNAYIDSNEIIRLRGRANAMTAISDDFFKQPIILDGKHDYTKLLVLHYHVNALHGSCETVVNELRQRFWIVHLRPTVKSVERTCQQCQIRKAKPTDILMGNLPPARLAYHQRPFSHCGLDYFGPMLVTIGRRREKRYGALFTCLTTRAVHIELAASLSTDSAILALRRMMARRGCPTVIYSDNGTNFRGADSELKRSIKELDFCNITNTLLNVGVRMEWKFNPPTAAHMGGCWERLVRSFKRALKSTLAESAPSEEVLLTLLIEAEHIINSRPLTHVSVNPDDLEALTPNHFLLGTSSGVPIPGYFQDTDLLNRKHWRKSQRLADVFWQRWAREYLPTILPRSSSGHDTTNLKPGDYVLVADPSMPRNIWPRGIIEKVFPGPDGRVRVVEIRTVTGVLKRPVSKLIRLPVVTPNSS